MAALSTSVPIHVQPQAQLVAMATGVEWGGVERDGMADFCLLPPPLDVWDLPDKHSIVAGGLKSLH